MSWRAMPSLSTGATSAPSSKGIALSIRLVSFVTVSDPATVASIPETPMLDFMKLDPLTLTAVFEPVPEGGYTCHFEELPEIFSQGETLDEARTNLADALKLVMEHHRDEARARTVKGALREPLRLVPA
jgi:predicted RNase H-like HicB family nuclease